MMKQKEKLAFDAADIFCTCEKDGTCVADVYMNGYIAGFNEAKKRNAMAILHFTKVLLALGAAPTIKDLIRLKRIVQKTGENNDEP